MSMQRLHILLLGSEWKSSKGGLSTMNREMAIQIAKHPNVVVFFFVPKCSDKDKREAKNHNVIIVEAEKLTGFKEPVDWLAYLPNDLAIHFVVGHSVVLGKQAQIITKYRHGIKWVHVVHTAPDELAIHKNYDGAFSKGDEKQWDELELCEKADFVIAVGPKLTEVYSAYFNSIEKIIFNFTPGIFTEFPNLKRSAPNGKKFRILLFGRGDSEDFKLKGFDIAARAVAALKDKSYLLIFVGAPSGSEETVAEKLLAQGLDESQLTVKPYAKDREKIKKLLRASNLALIPSRTEGFGLTALEALSAGLPFLVSQNSGFAEALQEISVRSSFIVDSKDPKQWAEAIKCVRQKGSEAIQECQDLRTVYAEKYDWQTQCNNIVRIMSSMFDNDPSMKRQVFQHQTLSQTQLPEGPIEPAASSSLHASSSETSTVGGVQGINAGAPGKNRAPYTSDQWATKKQKGHDLKLMRQMFKHKTPKQTLSQTAVTQPPVTEPVSSPRLHTSSPKRPTVRERVDSINRGEYKVAGENGAPHIRDQGARPKDYKSLSRPHTTILEQTELVSPPRLHTSSSERPTVRQRVDSINRGVYEAAGENRAPHTRDQGARPKDYKSLSKPLTTKQKRGSSSLLSIIVERKLKLWRRRKSQRRCQNAYMDPEKHLTQVVEETEIVSGPHNKGAIGCVVQEKSVLAKNVVILLKILLNYGRMSTENGDIELMCPDWTDIRWFLQNIRLDRRAHRIPNLQLIVFRDKEGNLGYTWVTVTQNRSSSNLPFLDKILPPKASTPQPVKPTELAALSSLDTSLPENSIVRERDQCMATTLNLERAEENTAPHVRGRRRPRSKPIKMKSSCAETTKQRKGYDPSRKRQPPNQTLQQTAVTTLPVKFAEQETPSMFQTSSSSERPTAGEKCLILEVPEENRTHDTRDRRAEPLEKRSSNTETSEQIKGYDPSKKRQMFQYQPPNQTLQQTTVTTLPVQVAEQATASGFYTSSSERPTAREIGPILEVSEENSINDTGRDRRAKPLEKRSSNTKTSEQIKDLAILGCNASMDSMYAVTSMFENIRLQQNLNAIHPVKNLSPAQIKQYLENNSLRSCVLVMDAETVKDALSNENLPEQKNDYEVLFKTLVDTVGNSEVIQGQTTFVTTTESAENNEDQTLGHHVMQPSELGLTKQHFQKLQCTPKIQQTHSAQTTAQIVTSSSAMPHANHSEGIQGQTTFIATTESAQNNEDQTLGYWHVVQHSELEPEKQHFHKSQCTPKMQQTHSQTTSTAKCTLL